MDKSSHKFSPKRGADVPAPADELFPRLPDELPPGEPPPEVPAPTLQNPAPRERPSEAASAEDWTLDEPVKAGSIAHPTPARPSTLPAHPNHSSPPTPQATFETNRQPAEPARPQETWPAPGPPPPVEPAATTPPDPFGMDEELPDIPADSITAPRDAPDPKPTPGLTPSPPAAPAADPESPTGENLPSTLQSPEVPAPQPKNERLSRAVAAVILLTLLGTFAGILYTNRPASDAGSSKSSPSLPLSGQLITLTDLSTGWRTRVTGDLVSAVEVALPSASRQLPALLPQLKLAIDTATGRSGYLRIIFLDPDRKISGDVRVLKVNGQNLEPLNSGAKITGPGSALVYGSLGFMDRPSFIGYASSTSPRWSIELSESSDYNAKESGWTRLETFDIRNATDP